MSIAEYGQCSWGKTCQGSSARGSEPRSSLWHGKAGWHCLPLELVDVDDELVDKRRAKVHQRSRCWDRDRLQPSLTPLECTFGTSTFFRVEADEDAGPSVSSRMMSGTSS